MLHALCLLLVLCGCEAVLQQVRPVLEHEGEVYLYIQPLPQEAERLRFTIEQAFAVSQDGREIPLRLSLRNVRGPDVRKQRLLASGSLPPGAYTGLLFKVKEAIVKVEDEEGESEAALLVPEGPIRVNFSFDVARKKGLVLSLVFKYYESIQDRINFAPAFSIFVPSKPPNTLIGYVTNAGSNNVMVFDRKKGQIVGVIPTGRGPAGMALDQSLLRVYIALPEEDAIEVIDVTAGDIVNRMRLNSGDRPRELALTPDRRTLLTVNAGSNTVSFFDPSSLFELGRINVGNGPSSLLIDQTGRRAFVFNTLSSTISVVDIPNRGIVTTISVDPGPLRGQFNRRGNRLYVIHELSSNLTVIDPASFVVQRRFRVRIGMNSIKVDNRTDFVYLGRKTDSMVEVYDPFSFFPVDSVNTGTGVVYMAIDRDENNLYLVSAQRKRVLISNLVSKKIVSELDVGEDPYWVTMIGEQ
jgi:DNA-binding beta-propeller fold protein YncE